MAATTPHISLAAETLTHIGSLSISNSLLSTWVVMTILIFGSFLLTRKLSLIPTSSQLIVEWAISRLQSMFKSAPYFPLLATFFIFIIASNWSGLLPGLSAIGFHEHDGAFIPLFRAPTADINTTLALSLVAMFMIQLHGFKSLGLGYLKKFFNFQSPVMFFVGLLELISELSRIISFTFRLFGNIFAGEVLLVVIAFLVPIFLPIPFLGLEIFVGFIQALVFTLLVSSFFTLAATHESSHAKEVTHTN